MSPVTRFPCASEYRATRTSASNAALRAPADCAISCPTTPALPGRGETPASICGCWSICPRQSFDHPVQHSGVGVWGDEHQLPYLTGIFGASSTSNSSTASAGPLIAQRTTKRCLIRIGASGLASQVPVVWCRLAQLRPSPSMHPKNADLCCSPLSNASRYPRARRTLAASSL